MRYIHYAIGHSCYLVTETFWDDRFSEDNRFFNWMFKKYQHHLNKYFELSEEK